METPYEMVPQTLEAKFYKGAIFSKNGAPNFSRVQGKYTFQGHTKSDTDGKTKLLHHVIVVYRDHHSFRICNKLFFVFRVILGSLSTSGW